MSIINSLYLNTTHPYPPDDKYRDCKRSLRGETNDDAGVWAYTIKIAFSA
jgi:hypothetical protein